MGICAILPLERWLVSMNNPIFRRKIYDEILE